MGQDFSRFLYIQHSLYGSEDKLLWSGHSSGNYTVSAGYKWLVSNRPRNPNSRTYLGPTSFPWKDFWKSKLPYRVLVFGWKVLCDALPTKDKLQRNHINVGINNLCLFCYQHVETSNHLFLHCSFSKVVWFGINLSIRTDFLGCSSVGVWVRYWLDLWKMSNDDFADSWIVILTIMDAIWFHINQCLWKGYKPNPINVIQEASHQILRYKHAWTTPFQNEITDSQKDSCARRIDLLTNPIGTYQTGFLMHKISINHQS